LLLLALRFGRVFLATASGLGIGALAFYGLGLSKEVGIIERSAIWPQYVRDRLSATYGYVAASLAFTAGSAVAVSRSPVFMNFMIRNSILVCGFFIFRKFTLI
jgi:hypothetical protein